MRLTGFGGVSILATMGNQRGKCSTKALGAFTKRGELAVTMAPSSKPLATLYGALKDQIVITGDIVTCDWSDEFDTLRR